MKRAKQRRMRVSPIKPRNPVATSPLLAKGGAHRRRDKRAERARQKATFRRERDEP